MRYSRLRVWQFNVHIIKVVVLNQWRWVRIENVNAEKGHFQVPVYYPIELKIFVIVAEWINQLLAELRGQFVRESSRKGGTVPVRTLSSPM